MFEGSPPCTAFSTAGKRHKGWGQTQAHSSLVQTKIEDLFYEWLRVLGDLHPRAFVAENVAGMTTGIAKGYYLDVLRKMTALGYQTDARVIDAQYLGVPQRRSRVIFMGVRQESQGRAAVPAPAAVALFRRRGLALADGGAVGSGAANSRPKNSSTGRAR